MPYFVVNCTEDIPVEGYEQDEFVKTGEISARLRAARKAARLNQTELGALGGVSLNTQMRYEAGRLPTIDYLLRLGEAGIDWYWILTGQKITGEPLTEVEAIYLDDFRALPVQFQKMEVINMRNLRRVLADDVPRIPSWEPEKAEPVIEADGE